MASSRRKKIAATLAGIAALTATYAYKDPLSSKLYSLVYTLGTSHEICGDGYDNDGSGGDELCGEPDKDADGYGSDTDLGLYAGKDCDDTDNHVFPGVVTTTGCSSNQARICNSDGTFGSCFNFSSATASDFGTQYNGNLKWCDPTKTTDSGSGTWASPLNCKAFVDSGMATYYDPGPGDVLAAQQTGSYSQTYTNDGTRVWYWNDQDGTSSHGILIWGLNILAPNTGGTEVRMIDMTGSSYITLMNTTLNGNGDSTGYSNAGIDATDIDHLSIINMTVHDVNGDAANNVSGIKIRGGDSYIERGTLAYDNYDRSTTDSVNNVNGTTIMDVCAWDIGPGTVYNTHGYGYGDKNKHGDFGCSSDNFYQLRSLFNLGRSAFHTESAHVLVRYNRAEVVGQVDSTLACWEYAGCDSTSCEFNDTEWIYNTCRSQSSGILFQPEATHTIATPALTYHYNIGISTKTPAWASNGDAGSDMRVCHYCDDTLYTNIVTGGKFSFTNNCWYNENGIAFLGSIFGSSSPGGPAGSMYTSWTAWTVGGWDAGSTNEDPEVGSDGIADSDNCSDKGAGVYWAAGGGGPTPTPTATPTPTPTPTTGLGFPGYLQ